MEVLAFVAVGGLVDASATDDGGVLAVDFEVPAVEPEFALADVVVLHHHACDAKRLVDRLAASGCEEPVDWISGGQKNRSPTLYSLG